MRLTLTIELVDKSITLDDLKRAVAKVDEEMSGPGEGVAPENVDVMDIIGNIYAGEMEWVDYKIIKPNEDLMITCYEEPDKDLVESIPLSGPIPMVYNDKDKRYESYVTNGTTYVTVAPR